MAKLPGEEERMRLWKKSVKCVLYSIVLNVQYWTLQKQRLSTEMWRWKHSSSNKGRPPHNYSTSQKIYL